MQIVAENVGKKFGRRIIFAQLDATFAGGEVVAITGRNGSGKSTLLRILAGLLSPTYGRVFAVDGQVELGAEKITARTGFVAPYLNVYDSFSARENLEFVVRARRLKPDRIDKALESVGLNSTLASPVSTYSSGMMQRVRLAAAILHDPDVLMLDEPTSNLDSPGREVVRRLVDGYRSDGRLVILATNDDAEAERCDRQICVGDLATSVGR